MKCQHIIILFSMTINLYKMKYIIFITSILHYLNITFAVCDSKSTSYIGMVNLHDYFKKSCDVCLIQTLNKNTLECASAGIAECTYASINMTYNENMTCNAPSNIYTVFTEQDFIIAIIKKKYPIGNLMEICVTDSENCKFGSNF